jgi:hypothetical protein
MTLTPSAKLDDIRAGVINRMERHARNVKLAMGGAAFVEVLLIGLAAAKLEFSNRFEVLVFAFFLMTYTIVLLGLGALGAHVSRVGDRVIAALADRER